MTGVAAEPNLNDLLSRPADKTSRIAVSPLMDATRAGSRLVVVGEAGRIGYSDDNGTTWSQAEVPVSITLTAVTFPTPEKGWAVGHDGVILNTTDSGATWKMQLDGSAINEMMHKQISTLVEEAKARLSAASEDNREELEIELEDLEYFLSDAEMGVREGPTRPFMDVWFADDKLGLAIGSFGIIFRTVDGGENWESILGKMDNPDGFHYYAITHSGDSLYIVGEMGMLFRSDDLGASWTRLDSPYEGSFFGIVGHSAGDFVLTYGLGGNTFRSEDGGVSWSRVDKPKGSALSAASVRADGTVVLIGYNGQVMHSDVGGHKFSPLAGRFPGSVAVLELDNGEYLVVGVRGLTLARLGI